MSNIEEKIKESLEAALDAGFPKIEEEGPEKIANKRGPALQIVAVALLEVRMLIKAFGGCEKCWGKGYGTSLEYADGGGNRQELPRMRFCPCDRGKQLGDEVEALLVKAS